MASPRSGLRPNLRPNLRRNLRLYWLLQRAALRSGLQYRGNMAIMVIAGAAYQGTGFAFLWVLLNTVPTVAGWELPEVAFLYGLRLLAHALWLVVMSGINNTDDLVHEGNFDRVLLRPVGSLIQLAPNPRSLMPLGDLLVALSVFAVAAVAADIDWSPALVLVCVFGVIGGALVEASAAVASAALTLRFVNLWALRWLIDDTVSIVSSYPMAIYSTGIQRVLTYAVPVAFVAYLPASVVLRRTDDLVVPVAVACAGPLVGAGCFALACLCWARQLRRYQSVGH